LSEAGLGDGRGGSEGRRGRLLYLTEAGAGLEARLAGAQRALMRAAYRDAGPEAVAGFRQVLEAMMDSDMRRAFVRLRDNGQ